MSVPLALRRNIGKALSLCAPYGLGLDPLQLPYLPSREKVVPGAGAKRCQVRWRESVFSAMARNAESVTDFFNSPTNRVVELGTRVEI